RAPLLGRHAGRRRAARPHAGRARGGSRGRRRPHLAGELLSVRYAWREIAATGPRFADFRPYVASIDATGRVAFQATLPGGESGLYAGDGSGAAVELAASD